MRIVMISQNDPAGTGIAFTKAINRHTHHSCRLITTEIRYNFGFEKDLHLPNLTEQGLTRPVTSSAAISAETPSSIAGRRFLTIAR